MSEPPSKPLAQTPFRVHLVVYVLLGAVLAYVLVSRYIRPMVLHEEIGVEPARVAQVEQRIDPNVAGWAEIATLPGVGEVLAKRVVAYRGEHAGRAPVFRRPEDLQAVSGIGPKLTERMRPFLRFTPVPAGNSEP